MWITIVGRRGRNEKQLQNIECRVAGYEGIME
jgi:hypothetical protein